MFVRLSIDHTRLTPKLRSGTLANIPLVVAIVTFLDRDAPMGTSRDNFVRLAEARTTRVLKDLDLIGNLSNRSNYSFTEQDIRKIIGAIQRKLKDTESRFLNAFPEKTEEKFKL